MTKKSNPVKDPIDNLASSSVADLAPAADAAVVSSAANAKPDANRESILQIFAEMGISPDLNKSTDDLVKDLQKHVMNLNNKVVAKEADIFKAWMNDLRGRTNLTDEKFLYRLFTLGIHSRYLIEKPNGGYVFTDMDNNLQDRLIHLKVRRSGINAVETKDLFTRKIERPAYLKSARRR